MYPFHYRDGVVEMHLQRATIIEHLRERGRHDDGRAADALQWTIDQGLPTTAP